MTILMTILMNHHLHQSHSHSHHLNMNFDFKMHHLVETNSLLRILVNSSLLHEAQSFTCQETCWGAEIKAAVGSRTPPLLKFNLPSYPVCEIPKAWNRKCTTTYSRLKVRGKDKNSTLKVNMHPFSDSKFRSGQMKGDTLASITNKSCWYKYLVILCWGKIFYACFWKPGHLLKWSLKFSCWMATGCWVLPCSDMDFLTIWEKQRPKQQRLCSAVSSPEDRGSPIYRRWR